VATGAAIQTAPAMLSFQRAPSQASAAAGLLLMRSANKNLPESHRAAVENEATAHSCSSSAWASARTSRLSCCNARSACSRPCDAAGSANVSNLRPHVRAGVERGGGEVSRWGLSRGPTCDMAVAHASSCDKLCDSAISTEQQQGQLSQDYKHQREHAISTPDPAPARSAAAWPHQLPPPFDRVSQTTARVKAVVEVH
jgi:hypothetical protein